MKRLISGALLAIASLWLGSYCLMALGEKWYSLAGWMTGWIGTIAGVAVAIWGIYGMNSAPPKEKDNG